MNRDYYSSHIEFLKSLYKYNNGIKVCASYFLDKYYKKRAQGLDVTVKDL